MQTDTNETELAELRARHIESVDEPNLHSVSDLVSERDGLYRTNDELRAEIERLKAKEAEFIDGENKGGYELVEKRFSAADALFNDVASLHANCAGCDTCALCSAYDAARKKSSS